MKPIEINPVARSLPVGGGASRALSGETKNTGAAAAPKAEPGMVTRSETLSSGSIPPVDSDRVAQIRTAIKNGTYPLVPTQVADAMIAADYILIEGTKDN